MELTTVGLQIEALKQKLIGLFSRWADKDGVSVKFHETQPRMLIKFKTKDNLVAEIDYDINQTSKEYIDNMIIKMLTTFDARRKERQESQIIITTRIH